MATARGWSGLGSRSRWRGPQGWDSAVRRVRQDVGAGGRRNSPQVPDASGLRPGPPPPTHPSTHPGLALIPLLAPPRSGLGSQRAPVSSWFLTSGWEATRPQGAESRVIRRAGPRAAPSWPRGSAPRWLPCQPSARESGAASDPERRQRLLARARPPARGGVCRRSPPLPSRRRGPPRTDCAPRPPPPRTATPSAAARSSVAPPALLAPYFAAPQLPSPLASLSSPETRISKELKWAHTVKCWPKVNAPCFPISHPTPRPTACPTRPLTQAPPPRAPVGCSS